jgi:hypothetical protein
MLSFGLLADVCNLSEVKLRKSVNNTEESIRNSEHGESLKSRKFNNR